MTCTLFIHLQFVCFVQPCPLGSTDHDYDPSSPCLMCGAGTFAPLNSSGELHVYADHTKESYFRWSRRVNMYALTLELFVIILHVCRTMLIACVWQWIYWWRHVFEHIMCPMWAWHILTETIFRYVYGGLSNINESLVFRFFLFFVTYWYVMWSCIRFLCLCFKTYAPPLPPHTRTYVQGPCSLYTCRPGTADHDNSSSTPCVNCTVGVAYQDTAGSLSCRRATICDLRTEAEGVPATATSDRVCRSLLLPSVTATLSIATPDSASHETLASFVALVRNNSLLDAMRAENLVLYDTATIFLLSSPTLDISQQQDSTSSPTSGSKNSIVTPVVCVLLMVLLIIIIVVVVKRKRRRQNKVRKSVNKR
jgi:hypothetical protein